MARAAPSPFSLAAYIILPIERHTSFPLYISIYNNTRNIRARARRKGTKQDGVAGYANVSRGQVGASAGETLATAAELMYCVRGTMPRTDDVPHRGVYV